MIGNKAVGNTYFNIEQHRCSVLALCINFKWKSISAWNNAQTTPLAAKLNQTLEFACASSRFKNMIYEILYFSAIAAHLLAKIGFLRMKMSSAIFHSHLSLLEHQSQSFNPIFKRFSNPAMHVMLSLSSLSAFVNFTPLKSHSPGEETKTLKIII